MLLQTNSYIVPKDKRAEHARLLRRFRASLAKLGCDSFEVYEQVGSNWTAGEPTGRYVQIMRFRDRRHQLSVQAAERSDPVAQAIIAEFCQLINFPYQQQQGLFAVGFYNSVLPVAPTRPQAGETAAAATAAREVEQVEVPAEPGAELDAGDTIAEGVTEVAEAGVDAQGEADDMAETPVGDGAVGESDFEEVAAGVGDMEDMQDEAEVSDEAAMNGIAVEGLAPGGEVSAEPETSTESGGAAVGEDRRDGGNPATAGDEDDMGALLDAHVESDGNTGVNGETEHPLAGPQGAADDAPDALETIDLDALDLPDEPASESQRASNHFAR